MNFCRTFRNTALTEIGNIYTVQGRKFFLSFSAPYTSVACCSRMASRDSSKGEVTYRLHPYKLRSQPQFLQMKRERW